ncbi:MAG: hypothetical protein WD069_10750 [Planctomycetales bacterium]
MEPYDLLRYVASVLHRLAIPYLVTGSTVTIAAGEPRFTNDIDIVVDLRPKHIAALCAAFPAPDYYVSEQAVREAVATKRQFNVIHIPAGLKVDFILRRDIPFDDSRFARGVRVRPVEDYEATFASIEDVIVKKLDFYQQGGSDKHLRDIAGVLQMNPDRVDRRYIREWAERLGLVPIWEMVLKRLDARNDRAD